jgi:hypothetical protein
MQGRAEKGTWLFDDSPFISVDDRSGGPAYFPGRTRDQIIDRNNRVFTGLKAGRDRVRPLFP